MCASVGTDTRHGRRSIVAGLLMLALAGCQGTGGSGEGAVTADRVYESFPPGAPQDCIPVNRIDAMEPIGNHTLLFYLQDDTVWRNRLAGRCVGMRPNDPFLYEVTGSRLCSKDFVYTLDRIGGDFRRGPACVLGQFDHLTIDQAEALKALR
jgi:hypothetical protein